MRRFLREVGSVVLGVLIALGLGAIAGEIGWQIEVRAARQAMEAELGELIGQAVERRRMSQCIERRLDMLAAIVDRAAATGRLPPIGAIESAPYRTWSSGVWNSTISAQTAAHFDRDVLDNYSDLYEFAAQTGRANLRELDVWTTLYALVGPGRDVTVEEAARLRAAIGEARLLNNLVGLAGVRMRQVADAYGIAYDPNTVREYAGQPLRDYAICRAVPRDVPAHYGNAPLAGSIARALADPITRDGRGRDAITSGQ